MPGMGREPDPELDFLDLSSTARFREADADPDPRIEHPGVDDASLAALVEQLESDPGELANAVQGLASLDVESRARILRSLEELPRTPGIEGLLTRLGESATAEAFAPAGDMLESVDLVNLTAREASQALVRTTPTAGPTVVRGVVTGVDGDGKAMLGLSATCSTERRTALFLCDVSRGITEAVGERESESLEAGSLLAELRARAADAMVLEDMELGQRLLAGCLLLSGPDVSSTVAHWLTETVGPDFRPRPLQTTSSSPPPGKRTVGSTHELLDQAGRLLDACPSWLDRSPLTFELAEELTLREGSSSADPVRDAGAFRYLFEHRVLARLELYRRMLLWMALCWERSGDDDLAEGASHFAEQLSDEQFAVPGHPFAQMLMARSLNAAMQAVASPADPRRNAFDP